MCIRDSLCGIYLDERSAAAAFCDVTTGKAHLTAFSGDERVEHIINELGRFSPAEAILKDVYKRQARNSLTGIPHPLPCADASPRKP